MSYFPIVFEYADSYNELHSRILKTNLATQKNAIDRILEKASSHNTIEAISNRLLIGLVFMNEIFTLRASNEFSEEILVWFDDKYSFI